MIVSFSLRYQWSLVGGESVDAGSVPPAAVSVSDMSCVCIFGELMPIISHFVHKFRHSQSGNVSFRVIRK